LVPNPRKVGPKEVVRYAVKKGDKGGFQVGQEGQIVLDAGPGLGMSELLFGVDQDSDQNALVQLVSREPLAATVALLINGTNVGNFGLDIPLVTNPDQQYELPALGFDPGANPSHYQIRVPLDLLDIPSGEPDRIHFELEGSPGFLTNNEVLGIFLRGGEQNVWTVAAPAPPSFSSVARMTNGIRLRLQGPPQSTYIVEHSPMIPATSWSPLSTNVITGSSVDVLDPASGLQQRFYRARLTDGVVPSVLSGSHCTLTPVAGPGGTLTAADLHGTVMPSGRIVVARGTNQTFNALPDTNHVVSDWHVDGQLVQTNGTSFTLTNIQAFHFLSVDFLPTTDVAVAKEASAEVVLTNSLLTFTVSVENRGGSALTGVTVTDPLPPNVEFVAATSDVGSCTNSNGTVTCDVGSLLPGAAATITIQVTSTVPGFLTNSATVTALEADVVPENNSSTTIVQVVPPP
jgi:uncharacterized repeat protein (TIGR01451 family)